MWMKLKQLWNSFCKMQKIITSIILWFSAILIGSLISVFICDPLGYIFSIFSGYWCGFLFATAIKE